MKALYSVLRIFLLLITLLAGSTTYSQQNLSDPVVKVLNRKDKNVQLAWRAFAGDVSQYVLERSIDGRRFQEIAVVVAMFSNDEPFYEYTDRLKISYTGPLYYRLRVEGLDGGIVYTPVTTLKAAIN